VKTKVRYEATKESFPSADLREARLQEIRREALNSSLESLPKRRSSITNASPETGYYGMPLLKKPQWTNEVPLYFFCGGAAGAAAIIASVAAIDGHDKSVARDARYIAAIGGMISPALLISDLGMPSRFLHMLRIFKPQSAMSVGSWTLMAFSSSAAAAAFLTAWQGQRHRMGRVRVLQSATEFIAAITGAVISSYTGVLLGASAIPVWNQNVSILPVHFATSAMAAASALLELKGHQTSALNAIGIVTALGETAIGASIELRKNPALKPLKSGSSGRLTRIGGLLSGPVPLILRLLALSGNEQRDKKLRKIAAASAIAGSIANRFAWTRAGVASAKDNRLLLHDESSGQPNKILEP
jgi:hypothetical protein